MEENFYLCYYSDQRTDEKGEPLIRLSDPVKLEMYEKIKDTLSLHKCFYFERIIHFHGNSINYELYIDIKVLQLIYELL